MSTHDQDDGAASVAPLSERLATPLVWLGGAISTALILALFALTIYSIVMRYLVGAPVLWTDELTGYVLVALIMLGATEAYRKRNHIAIDLATGRLRGRARRIKGMWSDLCVLAFAIVLGASAWDSISFARMFGSYSAGEIEIATWIPQVPLLVAAFMLGVFAVARLAGRFAGDAPK